MGITGVIAFLNSKVPQVIRPIPSFNAFGGKRVFVDCSMILRRSLHASLKTILDRRKLEHPRDFTDSNQFIDVRAIKDEIMNFSVKPLVMLNKALRSVDAKGGIDATFVLGPDDHSLGPNKSVKDGTYINILDTKNKDLIRNLKEHFAGNTNLKFYPALTQGDLNHISSKLTEQFAKVQIRTPEIAKKCVEFCTNEDDYVLSDDTNVIAYGAPNVIRDYFGTKEPNTINHREMLDALDLSREQFIDFCILLGYKDNVRIPEIGPDRAYNIIKTFKSLESFLSSPLYQRLFKSKRAANLLSKHNMGLGEFTDRYFSPELREQLRSSNSYLN